MTNFIKTLARLGALASPVRLLHKIKAADAQPVPHWADYLNAPLKKDC